RGGDRTGLARRQGRGLVGRLVELLLLAFPVPGPGGTRYAWQTTEKHPREMPSGTNRQRTTRWRCSTGASVSLSVLAKRHRFAAGALIAPTSASRAVGPRWFVTTPVALVKVPVPFPLNSVQLIRRRPGALRRAYVALVLR